VHAADPDVRARMMGNPAAAQILPQLKRLTGAGIAVHCQVVLVPGVNGGNVLRETLSGLYGLYPGVRTVAVVPVGLTCHRRGLPELKPVGAADALQAIEIVESFAGGCPEERGVRFAFASDELYGCAGLPAPRYTGGEHTPQLANGVGLISDLLDGFEWALGELPERLATPRSVTIATGVSAFPLMVKIVSGLEGRVGNLKINVLKVENKLFGAQVTVAGLLCGGDIAAAAEGRNLGRELLVPQAALKSGGDVFLDGWTLESLSARLGTAARAVPCDGAALAYAACGLEENDG
jgi:putative radical SAM enzyme (TIGR03279 family)